MNEVLEKPSQLHKTQEEQEKSACQLRLKYKEKDSDKYENMAMGVTTVPPLTSPTPQSHTLTSQKKELSG